MPPTATASTSAEASARRRREPGARPDSIAVISASAGPASTGGEATRADAPGSVESSSTSPRSSRASREAAQPNACPTRGTGEKSRVMAHRGVSSVPASGTMSRLITTP